MYKALGIMFVVFGSLMLIWGSFTYTKNVEVVDAGDLHITTDQQETINWPPYVGGIILISGILVLINMKKG
jgi:hypothetical protein